MKLAIRTKAFERTMTEETLNKLRETRRANQADFTFSATEKAGNSFTISQSAMEHLGLVKNSCSFAVNFAKDEDGNDVPVEEQGAFLIVLEGNSGIFFKGSKVKDGGNKSKKITYDQLIADLQELGLIPAEIVAGTTKVLFDFEKIETPVESDGDDDFKILSTWKLVTSTKTKSSDEAEVEAEVVAETATVETATATVETATPAVEKDEDEGFDD